MTEAGQFQEFLTFCTECLGNSKKGLVKLIKKRYREADEDYVESGDFSTLLDTVRQNIEDDKKRLFVYLKEFLDELKDNKGEERSEEHQSDDEPRSAKRAKFYHSDECSGTESGEGPRRRRLGKFEDSEAGTCSNVSESDTDTDRRQAIVENGIHGVAKHDETAEETSNAATDSAHGKHDAVAGGASNIDTDSTACLSESNDEVEKVEDEEEESLKGSVTGCYKDDDNLNDNSNSSDLPAFVCDSVIEIGDLQKLEHPPDSVIEIEDSEKLEEQPDSVIEIEDSQKVEDESGRGAEDATSAVAESEQDVGDIEEATAKSEQNVGDIEEAAAKSEQDGGIIKDAAKTSNSDSIAAEATSAAIESENEALVASGPVLVDEDEESIEDDDKLKDCIEDVEIDDISSGPVFVDKDEESIEDNDKPGDSIEEVEIDDNTSGPVFVDDKVNEEDKKNAEVEEEKSENEVKSDADELESELDNEKRSEVVDLVLHESDSVGNDVEFRTEYINKDDENESKQKSKDEEEEDVVIVDLDSDHSDDCMDVTVEYEKPVKTDLENQTQSKDKLKSTNARHFFGKQDPFSVRVVAERLKMPKKDIRIENSDSDFEISDKTCTKSSDNQNPVSSKRKRNNSSSSSDNSSDSEANRKIRAKCRRKGVISVGKKKKPSSQGYGQSRSGYSSGTEKPSWKKFSQSPKKKSPRNKSPSKSSPPNKSPSKSSPSRKADIQVVIITDSESSSECDLSKGNFYRKLDEKYGSSYSEAVLKEQRSNFTSIKKENTNEGNSRSPKYESPKKKEKGLKRKFKSDSDSDSSDFSDVAKQSTKKGKCLKRKIKDESVNDDDGGGSDSDFTDTAKHLTDTSKHVADTAKPEVTLSDDDSSDIPEKFKPAGDTAKRRIQTVAVTSPDDSDTDNKTNAFSVKKRDDNLRGTAEPRAGTSRGGGEVAGPSHRASPKKKGMKESPKKGSSKQIRRLEKLLQKLGDKFETVRNQELDCMIWTMKPQTISVKPDNELRDRIETVRNRELDLNDLDDEASDYLLEDRLQRKIMRVWDKLCELHKASKITGRETEKTFRYQGTRYPVINTKIEKLINKKKIFPDYHDVHAIISNVNRDKGLNLRGRDIDDLAREAFTDVGNRLQERRQKDLAGSFKGGGVSLYSTYDDPALYDPDLKKKLEINRKTGKTKMDQIVEKYTHRQMTEGDRTEDEDDEEEEEAEREEEKENSDTALATSSRVDNSDSEHGGSDSPCLEIENIESGTNTKLDLHRARDVEKLNKFQILSSEEDEPTGDWSREPTGEYSQEPTGETSREPTGELSQQPSVELSREPIGELSSQEPTGETSQEPTGELKWEPTGELNWEPIEVLSREPSEEPSEDALFAARLGLQWVEKPIEKEADTVTDKVKPATSACFTSSSTEDEVKQSDVAGTEAKTDTEVIEIDEVKQADVADTGAKTEAELNNSDADVIDLDEVEEESVSSRKHTAIDKPERSVDKEITVENVRTQIVNQHELDDSQADVIEIDEVIIGGNETTGGKTATQTTNPTDNYEDEVIELDEVTEDSASTKSKNKYFSEAKNVGSVESKSDKNRTQTTSFYKPSTAWVTDRIVDVLKPQSSSKHKSETLTMQPDHFADVTKPQVNNKHTSSSIPAQAAHGFDPGTESQPCVLIEDEDDIILLDEEASQDLVKEPKHTSMCKGDSSRSIMKTDSYKENIHKHVPGNSKQNSAELKVKAQKAEPLVIDLCSETSKETNATDKQTIKHELQVNSLSKSGSSSYTSTCTNASGLAVDRTKAASTTSIVPSPTKTVVSTPSNILKGASTAQKSSNTYTESTEFLKLAATAAKSSRASKDVTKSEGSALNSPSKAQASLKVLDVAATATVAASNTFKEEAVASDTSKVKSDNSNTSKDTPSTSKDVISVEEDSQTSDFSSVSEESDILIPLVTRTAPKEDKLFDSDSDGDEFESGFLEHIEFEDGPLDKTITPAEKETAVFPSTSFAVQDDKIRDESAKKSKDELVKDKPKTLEKSYQAANKSDNKSRKSDIQVITDGQHETEKQLDKTLIDYGENEDNVLEHQVDEYYEGDDYANGDDDYDELRQVTLAEVEPDTYGSSVSDIFRDDSPIDEACVDKEECKHSMSTSDPVKCAMKTDNVKNDDAQSKTSDTTTDTTPVHTSDMVEATNTTVETGDDDEDILLDEDRENKSVKDKDINDEDDDDDDDDELLLEVVSAVAGAGSCGSSVSDTFRDDSPVNDAGVAKSANKEDTKSAVSTSDSDKCTSKADNSTDDVETKTSPKIVDSTHVNKFELTKTANLTPVSEQDLSRTVATSVDRTESAGTTTASKVANTSVTKPEMTDTVDTTPVTKPDLTETVTLQTGTEPESKQTVDTPTVTKPDMAKTVALSNVTKSSETETANKSPITKPDEAERTQTVYTTPITKADVAQTGDSTSVTKPKMSETSVASPVAKPDVTKTVASKSETKPRMSETTVASPTAKTVAASTSEIKPSRTDTVDAAPVTTSDLPKSVADTTNLAKSVAAAWNAERKKEKVAAATNVTKPVKTDTVNTTPVNDPDSAKTDSTTSVTSRTNTVDMLPENKPDSAETVASTSVTKLGGTKPVSKSPSAKPDIAETGTASAIPGLVEDDADNDDDDDDLILAETGTSDLVKAYADSDSDDDDDILLAGTDSSDLVEGDDDNDDDVLLVSEVADDELKVSSTAVISSSQISSVAAKLKHPEVKNNLMKLEKASKVKVYPVVKQKPKTEPLWLEEDEHADLIENYVEPDSSLCTQDEMIITSSYQGDVIILSDSD